MGFGTVERMADMDDGWLRDFLTVSDQFITTAQTIPERYDLMIREQEMAMGKPSDSVAQLWGAVAMHARAISEAGHASAVAASQIAAMIRDHFGPDLD
jgi:hypothetical protein